jgi:hypothetical protein
LFTGNGVISRTFFLLPNQPPKPLFSVNLESEWMLGAFCRLLLAAVTLRALPEDCEVVEDERFVSSSFALRALRAPTVSECCGGTSNVGNIVELIINCG